MVKSMTGFGRAQTELDGCRFTAEIKAVNHRYLDLSIRLPRKFASAETGLRAILKEYVERGKIDVFISFEDMRENTAGLRCNRQLAGEYVRYFTELKKEYSLSGDISLELLAGMPEVFAMDTDEQDDEELLSMLEDTVRRAAGSLVDFRANEGEKLAGDLLSKLSRMSDIADDIEKRAPEELEAYKKDLEEKVGQLLADAVDESRIAAEVILYADKVCVDEELVRLKSHIAAAEKELNRGGSIGRKLDFIAQEMNREANTTLSKSGDIAITDLAIELKTEIEKFREQIQNLE